MATALPKRAHSGPGSGSRRPGQHYSLSPVAQRRLRTLPLPFEVVTEVAPEAEAAANKIEPTIEPTSEFTRESTSELESISTRPQSGSASAAQAQRALVAQLSREVKRIEVAGRVQPNQLGRRSAIFSSGCSAIDQCLPGGGYESGTIIEYLQNSAGSGATTLALTAAREALAVTDRFCVVIDWRQQFYPPAAAALGLDLKRLIIVRPTTLADRLWAIDQALRSAAIVAVIAEVEQLDDRAARRLQLAAESGGSLGFLVRSIYQRNQPSWAEIQWSVRPLTGTSANLMPHRQLRLELLRARGAQSGSRVDIQVNATSGMVEPASPAAAALARTLSRPSAQRPAPVFYRAGS